MKQELCRKDEKVKGENSLFIGFQKTEREENLKKKSKRKMIPINCQKDWHKKERLGTRKGVNNRKGIDWLF